MENNLILAGDIGGTKTELAIFSLRDGKLHAEVKEVFPSRQFTGLEPVLEAFLTHGATRIAHACFGVAGPVVAGQVETPNLPWVVKTEKLAAMLDCESVSLLNDLEATAYGLFTLEPHELISLNEGSKRRPANQALIAAGTGLGEALLYDDGRDYHPIASEGGHGDFAPTNEMQIALLRYLIETFGHVSYERVVSGPGIANIYRFLTKTGRFVEPAPSKDKILAAADPSAAITQAALKGASEGSVRALELFVSVYGAEAGNLALRAKATGGIYIGGGIAPKILDKLKDGTFMRAFVDKGRYRDFLAAVPVQVVLNEATALQGAAHYAAFRSHG